MKNLIRPAVSLFVVLTAITGLAYPLVVTAVAQTAFPEQSHGSLLRNAAGQPVGSKLIGQAFSEPKYFWGRPSATSPMANNAANSAGTNVGPLNPALVDAVKARVAALQAADPGNTQPVPVDLVTTSASGVDPHISPAAAAYQAARVARERKLPLASVQALIAAHTEDRTLGLLGEPRVNVLQLNLALDQQPAS
ncbi:potassium-transporting ATPase subunit KdpC [Ideonella azotifigens]|uniref:Potassium-transporting ATPase KdpC subunit n=2 Tax=Ideonella azotifigens TaxID=513160 RepID=A0ABP3VPR2_9BURK|nr:potassium-transporting ATPase subunit KdpC [Ideonella azotifigens]MCD2340530.1 potassium-transporting ATPase subunit KdpC [Ideonella azotifigens]